MSSANKQKQRYFAAFITLSGLLAFYYWIQTQDPTESFFQPVNTSLLNSNIDHKPPTFSDITLSSGISFTHQQFSEHLTAINESLGSGVCLFDYDNDGWVDIFLVGGSGQTRFYGKQAWWHQVKGNTLYRNNRNSTFTDVTEVAGLKKELWGMGCASADLDNDGDAELLVTADGQNYFYENKGNGSFVDISEKAGFKQTEQWSTSIAIGDYDADGLLDVYISNYLQFEKGSRIFEQSRGYQSLLPESFNASLYDGAPNQLFHNQGQLEFEEVATNLGIENSAGRSLQAVWFDANQDDSLDLLIVNDGGSANQLFLNNQQGQFKSAPAEFRLESALGNHGIAIADINNDRRNEILLTSPSGQASSLFTADELEQGLRDINWQSGLAQDNNLSLSSWGAVFSDFNNDGLLDIYLNNGLISPDIDSEYVATGQKNQLLLNLGKQKFEKIEQDYHFSMPGRGLAYADFDNDGDIDLFISNNNNAGQLLSNNTIQQSDSSPQWLGLTLISKNGNSGGIGAKIIVTTDKGSIYRDTAARQSFLSQSEQRLHIGLGQQTVVNSLEVQWPDGKLSHFTDIPLNRYLLVSQENDSLNIINYEPITAVSSVSTLRAPFDQDLNQYLRWQTNIKSSAINSADLHEFYVNGNKERKLAVLNLIAHHHLPETTDIAFAALQDIDSDIQLQGIQVLQNFESEQAVYWLVEQFNNSSNEVLCQLANTFQFFFEEEEAVTQREHLAIPYLIELLGHANAEVVQCALSALGEAEGYRGINTIMQLLTSENNAIKKAAIDALGRIREGQSIATLKEHLKPTEESAEIIASILVALQRLADKDINIHLQNSIHINEELPYPNNIRQAVAVSYLLLSDRSEGVVISPEISSNLLFEALASADITSRLNEDSNFSDFNKDLLKTLSLTHRLEALPLIQSLLESKNLDLSLAAFNALLELGLPEALVSADEKLIDFLQHDETRDLSFKLFSPRQAGIASPYIENSIKSEKPLPALKACATLRAKNFKIDEALFFHADNAIRSAAYTCASNQHLSTIFEEKVNSDDATLFLHAAIRNSAYGTSNLLNGRLLSLFSNPEISTDILQNVLLSVAEFQNLKHKYILLKALSHPDSSVTLQAIKITPPYLEDDIIRNKVWTILKDEALDSNLRFSAGAALVQYEPAQVIAYLNP